MPRWPRFFLPLAPALGLLASGAWTRINHTRRRWAEKDWVLLGVILPGSEARLFVYLVQPAAFRLILVGIGCKNRLPA